MVELSPANRPLAERLNVLAKQFYERDVKKFEKTDSSNCFGNFNDSYLSSLNQRFDRDVCHEDDYFSESEDESMLHASDFELDV